MTYNGVEIGRVAAVRAIQQDDTTKAKLSLDVAPKYIELIPANVTAEIKASTVFGNKYVAFRSPSRPASARVSSSQVIDVSHVTTEFNTLFETLMSIAQKVDPVKLNLTLAATAEALDGHGLDFGRSIIAGNAVLDDINPEMPQIREDIKRLTDLATSMPNPHPISGNSSTMQRPRQAPSMSSEPISMRRCWLPRASATLALTSWGGGGEVPTWCEVWLTW